MWKPFGNADSVVKMKNDQVMTLITCWGLMMLSQIGVNVSSLLREVVLISRYDAVFPSSEEKNPLNNTLWMTNPQELACLLCLHWPLWESQEICEPFWAASLTASFNAKGSQFWQCMADWGADVEVNFVEGALNEEMLRQCCLEWGCVRKVRGHQANRSSPAIPQSTGSFFLP